jgi:HD-GYP domain-containing protein (c-di-GMP phosphodiesterase class II)
MVTTRAYRGARGHGEAQAELERCSGSQFDPRVVAAFAAAHRSLSSVAIPHSG